MIRILFFFMVFIPQCIHAQVFYKWDIYKYQTIYGDLLDDQIKNSILDTAQDGFYPLFRGKTLSEDDLIKISNDSLSTVNGEGYTLSKLHSFNIFYKRKKHKNYVIEYRANNSGPTLIIYSFSYGLIMKSYPIEYLQNYFFLSYRHFSNKSIHCVYRHHDYVRIRKKILKIFKPVAK